MKSTTEDLDQDIRLIERNLAKGFASPAEVRAAASKLEDVADKGEWRSLDMLMADLPKRDEA